MKKLKISSLIFAVALLVFPTSCSDELLDQNNINTVSAGIFWQNESDAELAVNGMFHSLTGTFNWGRIIHTGAMLRSDAFNIRPSGTNTAMSTFQGEAGVARWALEPFQENYKAIFRANAVIENVKAENVSDQATRDGFIGQAFFVRAFAHWYLLNIYGNIPLITETPESFDEFFPDQNSRDQVWAQIISDLEMAESLLPSSWGAEDMGRPTSGSATALKGKSFLYQGNWSEASQAFQSVINSGNYSLLPADRYHENFDESNENNEESVFELQYQGISNFVWGADIPSSGTMGNFHIDYAPPEKSPDQSHYINKWVKDLFETNGETIRRDQTLAYDYPGSTGYGGSAFTTDFAADLSTAQADGFEGIFSRKYAGMDIGQRGDVDFLGTNVGTNWRIIRYADVLLMQAEALNELGQTAEAEALVNRIRTRALVNNVSGLDQAEMRNAIINERVLELTGEGHRFFDLVRWNLAETYLGQNSAHPEHPKSISGGFFVPNKHEYVWIPAAELAANEKLVQNPGY